MLKLSLGIFLFTLIGCGGHRWHKSPSIAASGDTLYVANFCQVKAIDAKTGKEKWVYHDPHHKEMCSKHMKKYMKDESKKG